MLFQYLGLRNGFCHLKWEILEVSSKGGTRNMAQKYSTLFLLFLSLGFTSPVINQSQAAKINRGSQIVTIKDSSGNEVGLYRESHALVIGMSDYKQGWPKLPGVIKDIAIVQKALEENGFHVIQIQDQTRNQMFKSINQFINNYGQAEDARLLIYFAGHGYSMKLAYGESMGYFVPVDSPNPHKNRNGFLSKALDMQQVEVWAKRIQSRHALFMFDSCFSGSIFALSRAIPENISYKTSKPVRQFITAGAADEEVPDESIFRDQFVAALEGEADMDKDGYVTGVELGEFLQAKVTNYSRGSQHPQYGKIRNPHLDKGDFVFQIKKGKLPSKLDLDASPLQAKMEEFPGSEAGRLLRDAKNKLKQKDLERIREERKLQEIESHYSTLLELEKVSDDLVPTDAKIKAWQEFLDRYPTDNLYWKKAKSKHQRQREVLKVKEDKLLKEKQSAEQKQLEEKQLKKNKQLAKENLSSKIQERFSFLSEKEQNTELPIEKIQIWENFLKEFSGENTRRGEVQGKIEKLKRSFEISTNFTKLKRLNSSTTSIENQAFAWKLFINKYPEDNIHLEEARLKFEVLGFQADLEKVKYQTDGIFASKEEIVDTWESFVQKYENNKYIKNQKSFKEVVLNLEEIRKEEGSLFGGFFKAKPGKNELKTNIDTQNPLKKEKKVKSKIKFRISHSIFYIA